MDISKTEKVTITISLNEKEAEWLKTLMQNPLYDEEDKRDQEMRKTFWDVLNSMGISNPV